MDLEDRSCPLLEVLRLSRARRAFAAFLTSLQLDSGCMSPRLGLLCQVSSLERLFKGCADAQGMGKPLAHSLTVTSRVLHHMICSILLPRGGHRDEVSYLEAFIVDSIMMGRLIHVGYLMMMHMISYYESTTRVLPYDRFSSI